MALKKRQLAAIFAKLRAQGILRYIKKGQRKAPLQKIISAAKEDLLPSVSLNVIDEKRAGALIKRLPEKLRMEVGLRPHFSGETMPAPGMVGFYDSTSNTVNLRATSGIYGSRAGYTSLPSHVPRVRKAPLDPAKYPGEQRTLIYDRLERRNAALGSAKAYYHEYAHALQGKGVAAAVQTKGWKNIVGKEWTLGKGRTIAADEAFSEAFSMYASTIGTRAALRKARPESYRAMEAMFEGAGGMRVTAALRKHKEAGLKIGSPEARAKLGTFAREGRKKPAGQVAKALEAKKGKTYKSLQEMGEDIIAPLPPKPAVVSKLEKSPTAQEVDLPALQAELNKTKAGQTLIKRLKGGGQLSRNEERTLKAVTERMQKRSQQTTDDAVQEVTQAQKAATATKKTEKKRTTIAQRLRAHEEEAKKAAQKAEAAVKKVEQKAPKKPAETLTPEEKAARNLARRAVNARLYRERRRQRDAAAKAGKQTKKAERKQAEAKKETRKAEAEVKQQEAQVKEQKREREFWKVAALAGGSVALAEALRRWYKRRQEQREEEMLRGAQGRP